MTQLSCLVGKQIIKTIVIHDYIQLVLNDFTLTINNPFSISNNAALKDLEGLIVEKTEESTQAAILYFNNNIHIIIDLREGSYTCPEAMVLNGPDNLIWVWNGN